MPREQGLGSVSGEHDEVRKTGALDQVQASLNREAIQTTVPEPVIGRDLWGPS